MAAQLYPSKHDGKPVTHVDALKIAHTGTVVGKSRDGRWYYCRSDRPDVKPAEWHFKIGRELIEMVTGK